MDAVLLLLSAHVAATLAMGGVLWVVQLAIYPLFSAVAPSGFVGYHRLYTARIGLVVAPFMAVEALTAAALLWNGFRPTPFVVSLVLLAVVWTSTAAVQVPLHHQLARGFDDAAYRRLVRTNWIRTVAWTARAGLVLSLMR
jgi:hypothetical protein